MTSPDPARPEALGTDDEQAVCRLCGCWVDDGVAVCEGCETDGRLAWEQLTAKCDALAAELAALRASRERLRAVVRAVCIGCGDNAAEAWEAYDNLREGDLADPAPEEE